MKERPRYRKAIDELCEDYGWSLFELFEFTSYSIDDPDACFSYGCKSQSQETIEENVAGRSFGEG